MIMTGLFRLALHPGADVAAFEKHMTTEVFTHPNALQLTRITLGFRHTLLAARARVPGGPRSVDPHPTPQYVWVARVSLQTESGYDFPENAPHVQEQVGQFATLVAVEAYTNVGPDEPDDA
jgi:hypothetical protein